MLKKTKTIIKKHWFIISVLAILLIATVLRIYKLGDVPHGMTWDEAAIGYNGSAIFKTRRDEWLVRLPISFQSFGDYKAPFAIYLNGIFTYLFGMTLFAVRLPFVISSIFGVLGIILLTKLLFLKYKLVNYYSIFAGFLLTLSPWHFHYSRAGFESGMALTFTIWGLLFTIYSIQNNFKKFVPLFAGILSFALALYTYHSSKVVIPLILLTVLILFFKKAQKNIPRVALSVLGFVALLYPLIKDSIYGEGLARAGVTIFSEEGLTIVEKLQYVLLSMISHLSPGFLIFGETTTLRHGTGFMGVLFVTTLLLVLIGTVSIILNRKRTKEEVFFLLLILIGLLPASIALEVPHSNRALLALPGFLITAVYGLDYLVAKLNALKINKKYSGSHGENNIIAKSVVGTLIAIHVLLTISFLNNYFTEFSRSSADAFKDGYLEAFDIAKKYEKGLDGYPEVEKILFTSEYGQPYIYAIFARKTNPIWYRGGSLVKYEFTSSVNIGDLGRNNTLVVGSPLDDLPIDKADHIIYGSGGEMRFQMYLTESKND